MIGLHEHPDIVMAWKVRAGMVETEPSTAAHTASASGQAILTGGDGGFLDFADFRPSSIPVQRQTLDNMDA